MKTNELINSENFDESFNDFEFEILDYSPKVDLKNFNKTIEKEELNPENKIKTFINNVMRSALKIIFDSRNLKNVFYTKSQKDIDDLQNSFEIDIDDLLMDEYEDLKHVRHENSIRRKNIVIEFFINDIKNKEQKLLVEKWKIKYKEGDNTNFDENYFSKKFNVFEKTIITYSRILPLYNILKNKNYELNFKYYNDTYGKKSHFYKRPSGIVKLENENFFNFKLKIEYLNKNEIITGFELEKQNNELNENRERFFSIDLKKSSTFQIMSNYIGNMFKNENTNRKLSFEKIKNDSINTEKSQIFNSFISSSSSEYENCNETFNDVNKTKITDLNFKKISECSNFSKNLTEECTPRTQENKSQNTASIINNVIKEKNIYNINSIANSKIKNIMIDFNRFKELLNINQHFDGIDKKKLAKFVKNS